MIPSELQFHWLWQDKPFAKGQAVIDLILMSKEEYYYIRNKKIKLPIGQLVTSEPDLSSRWGWSRTKVRIFLERMEGDSLIKLERHSNMTQITIIYNPYHQLTGQEPEQEIKQNSKQEIKLTDRQENKGVQEIPGQEKKQDEQQQKNNSGNKGKTKIWSPIKQKTIFDAIEENNK